MIDSLPRIDTLVGSPVLVAADIVGGGGVGSGRKEKEGTTGARPGLFYSVLNGKPELRKMYVSAV